MDSGATNHVINDSKNLNTKMDNNGLKKLIIGNGQGLDIHHIGHGLLYSSLKKLYLKNILHVPSITKNLLSVVKLTSDNNVLIELFVVKDELGKSSSSRLG
ncbi:hypothetical protein TorRG33x02_271610 [Trema orientale]|uniref:Retrovirus-related Pol polyprotein from transposon TNT 1-94-like beta-barrel domain-containing protein n=1 Tax=Trema orientale TaxID=63057 RepID=A0A2P5CVM6_TREOI|nr:hypothetical protein TorRG33x02_271610 [Trema orientale]